MRVAETVAQDSIEADKTHATSPPLCTPEPPLNTTKSFGTDHDIKSQMKPSEEITHGSTECTSNEVLYVEGKHAWMRNSSATQDRSRPEDSVIDRAHHGRLVQAPAAPSSRQSSSRARDTGAPHARRAQGGEDHLRQDSCRQDLRRCVADLLDQMVPAALRREWQDGAPSHNQAHQVEDRRGRESSRDSAGTMPAESKGCTQDPGGQGQGSTHRCERGEHGDPERNGIRGSLGDCRGTAADGLNVRMVNLENALHQILEHLSHPPAATHNMPAESCPS